MTDKNGGPKFTIETNEILAYDFNDPYIKSTQVITDDFLDSLKEDRDNSHRPAGDFHKLCAIPETTVNKWIAEGFNILTDKSITPQQILSRLRKEELDKFIATRKRV